MGGFSTLPSAQPDSIRTPPGPRWRRLCLTTSGAEACGAWSRPWPGRVPIAACRRAGKNRRGSTKSFARPARIYSAAQLGGSGSFGRVSARNLQGETFVEGIGIGTGRAGEELGRGEKTLPEGRERPAAHCSECLKDHPEFGKTRMGEGRPLYSWSTGLLRGERARRALRWSRVRRGFEGLRASGIGMGDRRCRRELRCKGQTMSLLPGFLGYSEGELLKKNLSGAWTHPEGPRPRPLAGVGTGKLAGKGERLRRW